MSDTQKSWLLDIVLLCLLIGSCFAFMLGSRPLNVPDEGRYSEIPREMMISHEYVTPRINGIKYFEKPPFFYWMQVASYKTFGLNVWSARLMDALMGLLGCLGTYFVGRKVYDRKTAWFASLTLFSSLYYFILARVVTLDMTVSVLLCFSLFCFILRYYYLMYIFGALAVLTKGLIGIIFPGSIILLWMIYTGNWKILKEGKLFTGFLLLFAIAVPWHVLCQERNPEFFHYYFITQQFSRYLTTIADRYQPFWYFIPVIILGVFPWTGYLWGAIKNIDRKNPVDAFFAISALFIFIFYSVSDSKLVPYVLPCMPFMALLMGKYFANANKSRWELRWGFFIPLVAFVGGLVAAPIFLTKPLLFTHYAEAKLFAIPALLALALNIVALSWVYKNKSFIHTYIAQLIGIILLYCSLMPILSTIYMDSVKPMTEVLQPLLKPGDTVATYHYYYQDLPFYLNQTVSIVNWKGELEFGEKYTAPSNNLIDDATLLKRWNSNQNVYVFVPDHFYKQAEATLHPYYILAQEKQDMLITNHPERSKS